MPKFKKNTSPVMYKRSAFKMKGFSGFGNSPIKQKKEKEKPMSKYYKTGVTGLTPVDEFKQLGVGMSLPRIQLASKYGKDKLIEVEGHKPVFYQDEDVFKQKNRERLREKGAFQTCPKCRMKGTHCKC